MTDWSTTATEATAAAERILAGAGRRAAIAAATQVAAMAATAAQMEEDYLSTPPRLSALEYQALKQAQINALQGILSAYEAVGDLAAEQAAQAAWDVIADALKTFIPFA